MPPSEDTTPPPADNPQTQKLQQRKPKNLTPGAPDLPQPRRTSAEVRAEKERKEAEKEATAVKTKAAKARVEGIKAALRHERAEVNMLAESAKKARPTRGQGKNTPQTSSRGSEPVAGPEPETIASAAEMAVKDTAVSFSDTLGHWRQYLLKLSRQQSLKSPLLHLLRSPLTN